MKRDGKYQVGSIQADRVASKRESTDNWVKYYWDARKHFQKSCIVILCFVFHVWCNKAMANSSKHIINKNNVLAGELPRVNFSFLISTHAFARNIFWNISLKISDNVPFIPLRFSYSSRHWESAKMSLRWMKNVNKKAWWLVQRAKRKMVQNRLRCCLATPTRCHFQRPRHK